MCLTEPFVKGLSNLSISSIFDWILTIKCVLGFLQNLISTAELNLNWNCRSHKISKGITSKSLGERPYVRLFIKNWPLKIQQLNYEKIADDKEHNFQQLENSQCFNMFDKDVFLKSSSKPPFLLNSSGIFQEGDVLNYKICLVLQNKFQEERCVTRTFQQESCVRLWKKLSV